MIDLEIKVDYKGAVTFLDDMAERQMPFALAKAINATVTEPKNRVYGSGTVQGEVRLQLRKAFQLRQTAWADRSIKVTHFATKREPWATIGVHPPGSRGEEQSDILGKFETDTEKRSHDGRTIAVPISDNLRKGQRGIILKRDRPKGFHFKQVGRAIRGTRGTFLIRLSDGSGLILQRTKQGVFPLYRLVTREQLHPDLHFVETAIHTVDRVWDINMLRALDEAIRTAK